MMNIQESVPVNTSSNTQNSSTCTNQVQRITPLLYVGQSNLKPPAAPSPNPGVPVTSGPTILSAMPQIQLASGGNPQIIHSSPNPSAYSYVPVRQVYQQAKPMKDSQKKVFVASVNSNANNKSNQVNLILPNNQNTNPGNKPPITSLIFPPQLMSNKRAIIGIEVPNNSTAATNNNKPAMASLLLPTNSKYPNIAPHKKVPIPNMILPQQNMSSKPTNVPNIIRQTNNPSGKNVVGILSSTSTPANTQVTSLLLAPNTNNKQPPTSMGLILPTSAGSHDIIMPPSTSAQTHSILVPQSNNNQSHSIFIPQPNGGIIVPVSQSTRTHGILSTSCPSQLTNLIITSTAASVPHPTTAPVGSLLISNNNSHSSSEGPTHMTSLLMSQNSNGSCGSPTTNANSQKSTSIIVPVSAVGMNKTSTIQPVVATPVVTYSNGKKSLDSKSITAKENKQSLLMKPNMEGNYPTLPPLQPISSKDNGGKSVLPKTPNGLVVPESLIMTPITDADLVKIKPDKITDDMTIERTSIVSTDEKGTSTNLIMRSEEKNIKIDEEFNKTDVGKTIPPLKGNERDEGLVLDGEVTVRRLGPDKEAIPEKKQFDDEVKIELVKPERQKLPPPRYQKPEDLNPMEVLEWDHQGVGKLPGSNIKFRINEFGLDLVVDNNKDETPSSTPFSSRRNSDDKPPPKEVKSTNDTFGEGMDKIYCCEGCGCYGLYTEFLMDTRFCSVGCKKIVLARNEIKKKRQEDKLKELRLRRKRRKIKMLAQRSKRNLDQKSDKSFGKIEDNIPAWGQRVDLKRATAEVKGDIIKFTFKKVPDTDSANESSQFTNSSVNSDSEGNESLSRSQPLSPNNLTEDENSSSKAAANSDSGKETSWVNSLGEFLWPVYLQKCCNKAKAAPVRLFKDPFPYGKNGFKIGMKLEGIDPEHQAIISVLTVAQVKGHRIRLHFDGYPDHHDFWVNSDSPDIFPPGWCEKNNHTLHPPRGYTTENFSWNTYLKQCRAQPAPKPLFPKSNSPLCPSQFRVGMKLEAVDRKNSSLICVASVADLIDNRLLIHFDSWGDVYDYWTDPSSPYIHPVGWCEENGHDLTPPNSFKNPNLFSWEAYLKETKSQAAPARAFKPRPPNAFKRGMKLEAIDNRAPFLLRPATIREVKDYQIKITFDGYPEEFGYWVDDDCPDIHPTGWGQKTGHPVTPPPTTHVKWECGTKGCVGEGNIRGGFLTKHTSAALCPYSPQNLNKETAPDRFCMNPDFYEVPEPISKSKTVKQEEKKVQDTISSTKQDAAEDSSCSESRVKTRNSTSASLKEEIKEEPQIKTEPEEKTEERVERRGRKRKLPEAEHRSEQLDKLRKELIQSVFDPGYNPGYKPSPEEQEVWVKHVATLGHKVNVTGGDPSSWNYKQVAAFVNTVIPSRAKLFLDQEIDGETFLMLSQNDLTKVLGLKLGPALKIFNCIILLRKKSMT